MRPRASRLPGLKDAGDSHSSLHFASKASKWLDDEHLVGRGGRTNWKKQYKLRHNWAKGTCAVNEIQVAEEAPIPPVLVQMHEGVIYMADVTDGLRAWSAKGDRKMQAHIRFQQSHGPPTALAIDTDQGDVRVTRLVIGFEDGTFELYRIGGGGSSFERVHSHPKSSNGVISTVALAYPYALTMTATHVLSLYAFAESDVAGEHSEQRDPPRLLHSLKSNTVWPPLTTSLRMNGSEIIVSIAYAVPTYLSGWTVGIQEMRIGQEGRLLGSRLASAIDQHYRPLAFSSLPVTHHLPALTGGFLTTSTTLEMRHIHSKPTSLSYTHPYVLVSHPDNTLTLYLVTSTTDSLHIGVGSRLWGHTSSVSGAHVGGRGKAVSVSRRGDELRIWELEGGFASATAKRRLATGDLSVQIRAEKHSTDEIAQTGLELKSGGCAAAATADDESSELTLTRGWIGFDNENVVVLKEQSHGRQALVVYDFT